MSSACLWDAVNKLHDKLQEETTAWVARQKENEQSTGVDAVTGRPIIPDRECELIARTRISANREIISELAMMMVEFEKERKCCSTCKWLYVKDFHTGECDNEKTTVGITEPDGYCDYWEHK